MSMNSSPIADRVVYAQDTQPDDTRDGILWVDTSSGSRETKVYSSDTETWEPVAPSANKHSDGYAPGYLGQ